MELLITELRRAREAKGISLSDIADATLINLRFLEELEKGNFAFLPQTYVRAFLREYALQVDLNPDDVTRMYDDYKKASAQNKDQKHHKQEPPPQPSPVAQPSPPVAPSPVFSAPEPDERKSVSPVFRKIGLGLILAIGIGVTIWNLFVGNGDKSVEEIPFDSVMKEHESQGTPSESVSSSSVSRKLMSTDSLILQATTIDTVWIQIVIDDGAAKNYMIRPNVTRTWKAAGKFGVTVGNASSVEFRLNNTPLGKLGKPGAVVRNVQLTRSTLNK
ncbi:MAG: helix-turn-helix domain-containing protein [Bacteroidota bacterium]